MLTLLSSEKGREWSSSCRDIPATSSSLPQMTSLKAFTELVVADETSTIKLNRCKRESERLVRVDSSWRDSVKCGEYFGLVAEPQGLYSSSNT